MPGVWKRPSSVVSVAISLSFDAKVTLCPGQFFKDSSVTNLSSILQSARYCVANVSFDLKVKARSLVLEHYTDTPICQPVRQIAKCAILRLIHFL